MSFLKNITIVFLCFGSTTMFGQINKNIIEGKVKSTTGKTLSGVVITIEESTVTTVTDFSGNYSIRANKGDKLTFSIPGYQTFSKSITEVIQKLDVELLQLAFGRTEEDVISIAYNTRFKRDLTAAVSTTNYEQFGKRRDINTMNGLGGLINGLIVMSVPWADTGSDPSFYIRGLKTTNSNNAPLVLVDDVERNFGQLNPNEIESISVLKDAAALAVYGSRGANGVLLVTTKRGKNNKRDIIINAQMGMAQSLRIPQYLNSYDYTQLYNKAQELDGIAPANLKYTATDLQGYSDVVNGVEGANIYKYPNNDFFKNYLKPIVKQQQYDLTMTGGNDYAKYFVLLGYMNQGGMYKYGDNTFDRYNFRSNLDIKVFPKLDMRVDLAGRIENQTTPGGNYAYAIFSNFSSTPSNAYPIFQENGSLGGSVTYPNNPYGLMNSMGQRDQMNRFFDANLKFKLDLSDFWKGLTWNGRGAIDFVDGHTSQLTSSQFAVYQLNGDNTLTKINTDVAKTQNFWYNSKNRQFTFQTSFNYDRNWKNHRVNAMTLFYLRELKSMGISVPYKTVGFASQLSYAYLNKYLLDASVGYTGSENFSSGNRFGLFPSISGGWIMSEEGFLKDNNTLSFLKLRASYGVTGLERPNSDRFLYRENWGASGGYAFGISGASRSGTDQLRIGNDNLKWETSYKTNVGLDFGFFNNTLLWTIDGFMDNRKDILVQKYATTPSMAGLSLPYENAGETKSWGFDSELTYDKQISKLLRVTVKGNVMLTRSKIIYIDETFKLDAYQYMTGNALATSFGYVSNGLFTQDEITRRAEGNLTDDEKALGYDVVQNGGNLRAGDIKYTDLNGDKKIDGRDTKAIAGSSIPNLIGGLDLCVKLGNFDFSAQLMAMGQRNITAPSIYRNSFSGGGNATEYAKQAWTPETASTALYPRLSISNNSNNQQFSDYWVEDGSFIKLKTVEIGYNIPTKIINKLGISKTRIYANGYNVLCFDKVNDYDPENTDAAIYRYPFQRILTVGLNVTF